MASLINFNYSKFNLFTKMKTIQPKNPKSQHLGWFPFFLDLIEDNVRSRVLFPIATLCLYILIVISITNVEDTVRKKFVKNRITKNKKM